MDNDDVDADDFSDEEDDNNENNNPKKDTTCKKAYISLEQKRKAVEYLS